MKPASSKAPNFFPLMVRLEGRKCVVVGGGKVATEKIAGLLKHGANLTVVSPTATDDIRKLARKGTLLWKKRHFASRDVAGAFLVIAATNSQAVNSDVFKASRRYGILCNAVDDPGNCDFFYPAIVRRGPLQIAISTNGQSPAAAAWLRRDLEQQFGPVWGEWIEHIGKERALLMRTQMPTLSRRRKLLALASEKSFLDFLRRRDRKTQKH